MWQANAVMIPRELFDEWATEGLSNDEFCSRLRQHTLERLRNAFGPFDTSTGEIYEPEFDHVAWMLEELKDRFPKSRTPTADILNEVWEMAGRSKSVVEDLITTVEDYGTRATITSVGGLMKSQLRFMKGDFRSLQADATRIREQKTTDPLSFVDDVVSKTRAVVKALPPKSGPNAVGVKKLKALTTRGEAILNSASS